MIDDYRDLVLSTEIQILNHLLASRDPIEYKFQFTELKTLYDEIIDIQANNLEPVIQALWNKYPIVYGQLREHQHSNPRMLLKVAKQGKARIYTFNTLMVHLGKMADDGHPLSQLIDGVIHDMRVIKGRL